MVGWMPTFRRILINLNQTTLGHLLVYCHSFNITCFKLREVIVVFYVNNLFIRWYEINVKRWLCRIDYQMNIQLIFGAIWEIKLKYICHAGLYALYV